MADGIEISSDEVISKHPDILDQFLEEVLGHPEALVTDRSSLSHFVITSNPQEYQEEMENFRKKAEKAFKVDISSVLEDDFDKIIPFVAQNRG